jgi:hypothetical protein
MLIGMLITLIFGVSGGAESEFASYIPNIKKEIRQNVSEEIRKDTLMVLIKDYEKAIKKYDKEKEKLLKKVDRASADREVSTEVLLQYYDDYYQARLSLFSELIGYRLLFQDQLTDEELLLITDKAVATSKREWRKENKKEQKKEEKLEKVFLDIHEIIVKHISDSAKMVVVSKSLQDFESTVYSFVDESINLTMKRKDRLDEKDATREDIEKMYESTNQLRYRASREFARLREVLILNTDEKEWKAINKELKVFLNS